MNPQDAPMETQSLVDRLNEHADGWLAPYRGAPKEEWTARDQCVNEGIMAWACSDAADRITELESALKAAEGKVLELEETNKHLDHDCEKLLKSWNESEIELARLREGGEAVAWQYRYGPVDPDPGFADLQWKRCTRDWYEARLKEKTHNVELRALCIYTSPQGREAAGTHYGWGIVDKDGTPWVTVADEPNCQQLAEEIRVQTESENPLSAPFRVVKLIAVGGEG